MERSVIRIMNNSKTGNWKLYRVNFTSQVITTNGARSVWHFSHPVYQNAGCDVEGHVWQAPGGSHLLQSPVELCWPEGVQLNKVSPQQKHQTTVVHVQGVMMPVHLCKKAKHREGLLYMHYASLWRRTNTSFFKHHSQEITHNGCQSKNFMLIKW